MPFLSSYPSTYPGGPASPHVRWIGPAALAALVASAVLFILFGTAWGMLLTVALVSVLALGVNLVWFVRSSTAVGLLHHGWQCLDTKRTSCRGWMARVWNGTLDYLGAIG